VCLQQEHSEEEILLRAQEKTGARKSRRGRKGILQKKKKNDRGRSIWGLREGVLSQRREIKRKGTSLNLLMGEKGRSG